MGVVKPPRPLPYGRQCIEDDDVAAVTAQLQSDWLTQGPTIEAFEQALCQATGAPHAVAVSSGTAALHLACLAAGMEPGRWGLVPDITFVASANAVRYCGGTPSLVDVEPETGLTTPAMFEQRAAELAKAGRAVRAILPVSFAGAAPDLPAIHALARSIGACVIEDAAHALGARYEAAGVSYRAASCTHSDMAVLSFHPVKHVTTGEGGAITTHDAALYDKLRDLRSHGITRDPARLGRNDGPWYYEQQALGFNYRITDLQCALGVSQLRKLDRFVARRRELAQRYDLALRAPELAARYRPLAIPPGASSSHHLYVVRLVAGPGEPLASVAARRLRTFQRLRDAGIFAQVHYIPLHTQPDFVAAGLAGGAFPGADAYYASCISLPMFPAMADDDVTRVVECLAGASAPPRGPS
jgi:UDP-4-amino-4,6-dideoxy-N-acetyl-beta-L-altrosamine transaminase